MGKADPKPPTPPCWLSRSSSSSAELEGHPELWQGLAMGTLQSKKYTICFYTWRMKLLPLMAVAAHFPLEAIEEVFL